jgi:preprotein translocase SecE subunit
MAVAVQPAAETKGTTAPAPLWQASLIGALYVLGALAVVFYAVPRAWNEGVSPWLVPALGSWAFVNVIARVLAQLIAAAALVWLGARLAGPTLPKGIRGGIFWAIITIFAVFFVARWVAMVVKGMFGLTDDAALIAFLAALGGFGFLALRFMRGQRFHRWSVGMEEGGWFSADSYKRNQGIRVRRLTILGVLLLLGTGIYTMIQQGHFGHGDWNVVTPSFLPTFTLFPDWHLTGPLVLGGLAVWFAFRLVNHPSFADFLIATEAEMNKVSWTPRKRLFQDTIVVLITVLLLTLFLFFVDIFWGWFLSRDFIGVLPQTKYQYTVYIDAIPDAAKKEEVAKALKELGLPEESAKRLTEAAPQQVDEDDPDSKSRRQLVKTGLSEEEADALVDKLKGAGADAKPERGRGQQGERPRW